MERNLAFITFYFLFPVVAVSSRLSTLDAVQLRSQAGPALRSTRSPMPAQPSERDTISRNLRLITSWKSSFAFVVAPVLAYTWFIYTICHLGEAGFIPKNARIMLAIACWLLAFAIMWSQAETVREQLKQKGYEQRRSSTREIDYVFNLAILAACFFWLQRQGDDRDAVENSDYLVWVVILVWGALLWSLSLMGSIGPVLWFTVRIR